MSNDYQYGEDNRPEIIPFLPDRYSKVLELGCAYGTFRQNLTQKHEYWGIEPNHFAASIAETKLDRVLTGTFEEVFDQLPDHYFDLVICNDVIEHLADHNLFFQNIKQKLSASGVIVGSIPNVRYIRNLFNLIVRKEWKYASSGILDYTHLRFFTGKSLAETLRENSYAIERLEGVNQEPFKWSLKYFLKYPFYLLFGVDLRYTQFGFRIKAAVS